MVRAILRMDTRTREARIEGRYRTDDQVIRAVNRFRGEETNFWVSYLTGDVVRVYGVGLGKEEISRLTRFGGIVILPKEGEIQDSRIVFVPGNLPTFLDCCKGAGYEVDLLIGPLEIRSHVRELGALPEGKYRQKKRQEENRLLLQSVKDSETLQEAMQRAGELLRRYPDLIGPLTTVVARWEKKA